MMTDKDLNLDQRRLAYLARLMDGIGEIDFHETAANLAEIFQREEVSELDYYRAVCVAIDTARNPQACSPPQHSGDV